MPASNVSLPWPLTRLNPWYPGQYGVPGTDSETGLRHHTVGRVFYVDPNHVDANDNRDGTDPNAPFATVGAALAHCQSFAGDVILVMAMDAEDYSPGTGIAIDESVTVSVHGVSIIGVHRSGAQGVVWRPAAAAGTCITVKAIDVLIEGFYFDGYIGGGAGGDAIYADWDGLTTWGDNLIVRHCFFSDTIDTAIEMEYTYNFWITDNVFQECDVYGIYADPAGSGAAFGHIIGNQFHDCGAAIVGKIWNCEIAGNRIFNSAAQGGGAATNRGIDTSAGTGQNLVANNWFSCLLPVAAPGDWNDLNTGDAADAWPGNWLMNGMAVTTPT